MAKELELYIHERRQKNIKLEFNHKYPHIAVDFSIRIFGLILLCKMPKFLEKINMEHKITRHGQTVQLTVKFFIPLRSTRIGISFLLLNFEVGFEINFFNF